MTSAWTRLHECSRLQQLTLVHQKIRRNRNLMTSTAYPSFHVLSALPDGVVVADIEGIIIFINKAALKMFEYETEVEVVGKNVKIFVHPTIADAHDAYIKRYATIGAGHLMHTSGNDLFGRTKSQKIIPVSISLTEYSENGQR